MKKLIFSLTLGFLTLNSAPAFAISKSQILVRNALTHHSGVTNIRFQNARQAFMVMTDFMNSIVNLNSDDWQRSSIVTFDYDDGNKKTTLHCYSEVTYEATDQNYNIHISLCSKSALATGVVFTPHHFGWDMMCSRESAEELFHTLK